MASAANQYEDPLIQTIRKSTTDPDWFCSDILNMPNDKWQSELMNAVADLDRARLGIPTLFNHGLLNRFSVVACHGPGKTHTAAKLMHWWNFTRKGRIPCTAPKQGQIITRLFPEFRKIRNKAIDEYQELMHPETKKITWAGDPDHVASAESASQPENLQGLHDDWLMFAVDEASGVHKDMYPAIEGSLTNDTSVMILIGNATKNEGEFYDSHEKRGTKELYYRITVSYKDSARVSRKWVADMARKYGKKSFIFAIRCLGKFTKGDPNALIALDWIEKAEGRELPETDTKPKIRVAVDVGDGGDDSSVTVGNLHDFGIELVSQRNFNYEPSVAPLRTADAAERIFYAYGGQKGVDDFVVDALGVGAGTAGTLIDRGHKVVQFKAGTLSTLPEQYANIKAECGFMMRDAFRDNEIWIRDGFIEDDAEHEDFLAQMCSVKINHQNEKKDEILSKRAMKSKGVKSPDRFDSASMLYAPEIEPDIEVW